jgi:hypothetical protein
MAEEHRDTDADAAARAAFLKLVGTGRIDEVRRILAASPQLVNAVGPHPFWGGRPQPLHVAIETRRPDMFDLLLEAGADVNGSNEEYDHWSPLMLTSHDDRRDRDAPDDHEGHHGHEGHESHQGHDRHRGPHEHQVMREELLRRGARIGLAEALLFADDARVEEWLRPGATAFPAYAPNGGSLLNFARTPFAIDRLIELGVPMDAKDRWGSTPIESMSRLGPRGQSLVRHMVARGVPAAPADYARLGDREKLATLIESDPGVAGTDAVMMGAVDFGHHSLVEWLLTHGANVNARANPPSRHTALHSAAWNGDLPMVTMLVAAGAEMTARDEEHEGTALNWAEVAIRVTNNPKCKDVVDYLAQMAP